MVDTRFDAFEGQSYLTCDTNDGTGWCTEIEPVYKRDMVIGFIPVCLDEDMVYQRGAYVDEVESLAMEGMSLSECGMEDYVTDQMDFAMSYLETWGEAAKWFDPYSQQDVLGKDEYPTNVERLDADEDSDDKWNRTMQRVAEHGSGKELWRLGRWLTANNELTKAARWAAQKDDEFDINEKKLACWALYQLRNRLYFRSARDYVRYTQSKEQGLRMVIGMTMKEWDDMRKNNRDPIRENRIKVWRAWKPYKY